jgi:hypothetical protein
MGWELRDGRRYLYRNRRVNGKPVKQYLAADDRFGFWVSMADDLEHLQRQAVEVRENRRRARSEYRSGIDGLLHAVGVANADLRAGAEALMVLLGYRRHNRGEWRMRRDLKSLQAALDALQEKAAGPRPLVKYNAPAGDAEAIELFAKVRAGEAAAQDRLRALIRERNWVDWLGDLGRQATRQLVWKASGGDSVGGGHRPEGQRPARRTPGRVPTVLERLLARRVVNGWLVVHTHWSWSRPCERLWTRGIERTWTRH